MTVFQYLEKVRQENPEYQRLNNLSLYKQLKGQDSNLPSWSLVDNPTKSVKAKTNKQSPGFLNSLFDWTDYGINETSWNFAKSAYNNSITGLAYQLHNGEAKYDLGEYNPGIIEDVASMVLSFAMPLDFASMFVGGYLGKAISAPMNAGIKAKAVDALVGKKAFTKAFGAGADFVMLGGMLAFHDESDLPKQDGKYEFYGMSSDRAKEVHGSRKDGYTSTEGKRVTMDSRGPVRNTIKNILGGLRSACTMIGARRIKDIPKCATFVMVNNQQNKIF